MVSPLLVNTLIFLFCCANLIYYQKTQNSIIAQRRFTIIDCSAPRLHFKDKHYNTFMYVPVNVINGKGKIVKIPPIARNSQIYYKMGSKTSSLQEIDAFLDRKAINNDVMITICDSGYLDIFRLFYRLNKMWQYSNFVAFVLDRKGYNILSKECSSVFYYKNDILNAEDAARGTRMWTKSAFIKMVLKLAVIRDIVNCGYNVLYVDSDILLFNNPFTKLQEYSSYDIVAQRDDTLCAGFMYLMSTIATRHILYNSIYTMYQRGIMDQDALQLIIQRSGDVKFSYLPSDLFMSGRDYTQTHQFFWDRNENDTRIISYHNNFIIMISNKLYRWREQGFYLEDKDGSYYSTPPGGYLLVDNVSMRDLSRLSSLVMSLNRTLIMPAMSCPPSVNTTRCTICAWDDRCAYGFQASIGFRFRAHVEQILYDNRTSSEVLRLFQSGPTYEYKCGSSESQVKENMIYLPHRFNDSHLQPGDIRKLPLLHLRAVPSCIRKSKINIRGE